MTIPKQSVTHLPVLSLVPHPGNIRNNIGDVDELALSIREQGIIQPIVVTEHPTKLGKWLILAGHRRKAAAERAGLAQVPCVIRHGQHDDVDQIALMLVENCQRRDLGPVEKAEAIGALMNRGLSQTDVARRIGLTPATVNYYAALLELDEEDREAVRGGDLLTTDAIAAVRQERMARRQANGEAVRGRPVQVEPHHFRKSHPLAGHVAERCDHTTRTKVGSVGCGQCWEAVIREDTMNPLGGGRPMLTPSREVDQVAVQRRISGDHTVELNIGEKREAVRILHTRGLSDGEISRTIGHTDRQVLRIRQELDLPANVDASGNRVNA